MAEPEQDFHAVHINDVEIEKSDHGYTKHLMHSKGKGFPSIQVRHWGPETDIDVHRHPYNEMFYVLEGEVEMGDKVYPAGSCIYIGRATFYGPTRAPKGATVLRYADGPTKAYPHGAPNPAGLSKGTKE
jgi:mannose-6-phosphate isomerase-like protein (cupin superfamily)